MTELQRYLAEEVVEDHQDGILTRREAMRRLALLGVSATVASSLLARAPAPALAAPPAARGGRKGMASEWAPVGVQDITFPGPRGALMGAWAPAVKARGGVLVIHENRGLTDHIRRVAARIGAAGFSALALDLLSEEGGTGAFPGEAEVQAALSQIPPERFDADMKAAVGELARRLPRKRIGAIGFCFGGAMVWRLLAAREKRLHAAAPFYGPFPAGGDLRGIRAEVLAAYAGRDDRVNATRDAAAKALRAAGVRYHVATFTEAEHAFFNDTGMRFDPAAAAEAWRRVVGLFERALVPRR